MHLQKSCWSFRLIPHPFSIHTAIHTALASVFYWLRNQSRGFFFVCFIRKQWTCMGIGSMEYPGTVEPELEQFEDCSISGCSCSMLEICTTPSALVQHWMVFHPCLAVLAGCTSPRKSLKESICCLWPVLFPETKEPHSHFFSTGVLYSQDHQLSPVNIHQALYLWGRWRLIQPLNLGFLPLSFVHSSPPICPLMTPEFLGCSVNAPHPPDKPIWESQCLQIGFVPLNWTMECFITPACCNLSCDSGLKLFMGSPQHLPRVWLSPINIQAAASALPPTMF